MEEKEKEVAGSFGKREVKRLVWGIRGRMGGGEVRGRRRRNDNRDEEGQQPKNGSEKVVVTKATATKVKNL